MDPNALECGVCNNIFSKKHYPRILPCSHTFCGQCIDGIISSQNETCPFCREKFTASSAEDLLFNRIALDAAKQFASTLQDPGISSRGPVMSFEAFNDDLRDNFIKKAKTNCKEIGSQIVYDISILRRMNDDILKANRVVVKPMEEIELSIEETLGTIDENIKLLKKKLDAIQEVERIFKDYDAKLEATADFTSAGIFMDDCLAGLRKGEVKVLEIKTFLRENERKTDDIVKEMIKTQTNLIKVAGHIKKRVEENLCQVFAVKSLEGQQRFGCIKIGSRNKVFVSHLEGGDTPVSSWVIKLEFLTRKTSRRVFLDLGADERFLGRIIIKVIDDGNLALNFLHLCAGDLGPSYATSSIFGIGCQGEPGENVGFGDYVVDGGTSSRPVLSGVDWVRESKKDIYKNTLARVGDVSGWLAEDATGNSVSRFYIVLRDHPSWTPRDLFGVVEEGLQVLKDAILLYPDFSKIKIVNCGLVFSF